MENLDKDDDFFGKLLCAWPNWSFHIFCLNLTNMWTF